MICPDCGHQLHTSPCEVFQVTNARYSLVQEIMRCWCRTKVHGNGPADAYCNGRQLGDYLFDMVGGFGGKQS